MIWSLRTVRHRPHYSWRNGSIASSQGQESSGSGNQSFGEEAAGAYIRIGFHLFVALRRVEIGSMEVKAMEAQQLWKNKDPAQPGVCQLLHCVYLDPTHGQRLVSSRFPGIIVAALRPAAQVPAIDGWPSAWNPCENSRAPGCDRRLTRLRT